ncbi:hypothetical protein A4U88_4275 [Serratia marcescens]|nr:hypothetical protein A4U88_4275 [Serratia marcescens]AXK24446.1 Hypothetical protein SmN45_2681 [Serratia marcescens]
MVNHFHNVTKLLQFHILYHPRLNTAAYPQPGISVSPRYAETHKP